MSLKRQKPTTPGRRGMVIPDFSDITKKKPEKSLLKSLPKKAGRSRGKISVRHKGGGAKRLYRMVDFKQNITDKPAQVEAIEYDPFRSARIALIVYSDGKKSYVLALKGLKVGDKIVTSKKGEIKTGNRYLLKNIPNGTSVYNIELTPGKGGQLVRAAGTSAVIVGKEKGYILLKMPSGEIRKINENCYASIGELSFPEHSLVKFGKAGRKRWLGIRPTVRGKAMNPVDHPHGGGEGGTDIGLPYQKTPWGTPALGYKTRKRKVTSKFIVKKRKK